MTKFVRAEKMSKKKKKELDRQRRKSMGEFSHKNNVVKSKKTYQRHPKYKEVFI